MELRYHQLGEVTVVVSGRQLRIEHVYQLVEIIM
jgi:hypothetical protein